MVSEKGPRIICVGSNQESYEVLQGLIELNAEIVGLITLPKGKSANVCDYHDLHPICKEKNIPTIDTSNINSKEVLNAIRSLRPDYIYTLGWSQLFCDDLLDLPSQYVVGSHPSPLPEGRGRAPIPWTILQDCDQSAVTLFRMEPGVDSGPILLQKKFKVPSFSYSKELYRQVSFYLREAFCELYGMHSQNITIEEIVQDIAKASWRGARKKTDGLLDFSCNANDIERLIRAVSDPYPGAYSYYNGTEINIWRASLDDVPSYTGTMGQILKKESNQLLVQAGDQPLWLGNFTAGDQCIPINRFSVGRKFGYVVEEEIHSLRHQVQELSKRIAEISQILT